jgi:hypothetical protein
VEVGDIVETGDIVEVDVGSFLCLRRAAVDAVVVVDVIVDTVGVEARWKLLYRCVPASLYLMALSILIARRLVCPRT